MTKALPGFKEDDIMATNFRITVHRNGKNLHLKLTGDFDGTSAHELLNVLKRYSTRTARIFIHTSGLRNVHPFGLNVFHNNLGALKERSLTLVFTGEHASQLTPEKTILPGLTISAMPPVAQSRTPISGLSPVKRRQRWNGL